MIKVCYFTSKLSSDTRVFEKECTSLVKAGYKVYLISPNAKDEIKNGVHIIGVEYKKQGLLNRLFVLPKKLYDKANSINADIYHFNDPASLHYGMKLKRKGKKVIFDSFEDHPTLVFEKKSIPYFLQYLISKTYTFYEYMMCKKMDGIITCYHWTQDRLIKACKNSVMIFNFPILKENVVLKKEIMQTSVCYAGLISRMWYIENILNSLVHINNIQFNLAGNPADQTYLSLLKSKPGWAKVNYIGQIEYSEVNDKVYSKSNIAMALLDYIPLCRGNVGNLSNNKLFEYMLAGLPVICTDFILWKEIVETNKCGICVNPRDVKSIVNAINYLSDNPEIASQMGVNGKKIVMEKYNWNCEEKKLLELYSIISSKIKFNYN